MIDRDLLAQLAGFIALFGFVPYVIEILSGKARPSRVTWWVWSCVGATLCASYYSSGGQSSIWVPISYVLGPLTLALLSTRYGSGGWEPLDRVCLIGCAVSLPLWWLSGSPVVALLMNIVVDSLGAIPSLRKTWIDPASESLAAWLLFLAGNTLNMATLKNGSLEIVAYPLYLTIVAGVFVLLQLRPNRGYEQREPPHTT